MINVNVSSIKNLYTNTQMVLYDIISGKIPFGQFLMTHSPLSPMDLPRQLIHEDAYFPLIPKCQEGSPFQIERTNNMTTCFLVDTTVVR